MHFAHAIRCGRRPRTCTVNCQGRKAPALTVASGAGDDRVAMDTQPGWPRSVDMPSPRRQELLPSLGVAINPNTTLRIDTVESLLAARSNEMAGAGHGGLNLQC